MKWVSFVLMFFFSFFSFSILFAEGEAYQSELGLGYSYEKRNDSVNSRTNAFSAGFTYYFSPVNISTHPLAEAAFLEKASGFSVIGSYHEFKDDVSHKYKNNRGEFDLIFYFPNLPLYFAFLGSYSQAEYTNFSVQKGTAYQLEEHLGFLLTDGVLISGFYSYRKSEFENPFEYSVANTGYGVLLKVVKEAGRETIALEMGISKSNQNYYSSDPYISMADISTTTFQMGLILYFNQYIGLGPSLKIASGDIQSVKGKTYGFKAVLFPNSQFGIQAEYRKFNSSEGSFYNEDLLNISMNMRFK